MSYINTGMKPPTDYHKDSHLNVEVLVVKIIQLFILSSAKTVACMNLVLLFSKHNKYLLNIIKQIIQSQRLKAILTILGVVSKNTKEWIHMNLRTDQVNYVTKSQVHTTTDARIANDKSTNQEVKTVEDQCHNKHQELILSNIVTESDSYDNYSYTSCINWEIEKTPGIHSK